MQKINNYKELINRIQEAYDKTYNAIQIEDINDYLIKRNFPFSALNNLYVLITDNETYLPKKNKFKEIIDNALKGGGLQINTGLHRESPLQQLYRAREWEPDKILNNCKNIRNKQDVCGTSGLKSWEVSFLVIWERLKDVLPESRNIAKQRIIANGDKELHEPIFLGDLMPELKPVVESEPEMAGKIEHISQTLEDVI
ncbi:MAG: hypothetical protein JXN64_06450 [Spirochaetes bacterium]|nr:hypothetical protein [Spirochaetota bacterium]